MKILALLLILISPLQAQIFADIQTTAGNFTVELYHDRAPKAVANFIGLAQGTQPWIDSRTGKVRTEPFYTGITFHRVIDGFVNQFGSPNALGTDGPGYTFRDEFDPSLNFSTPYLLAMANSGPNTNGSQLFTTVATPTNLNNIHTILGIIPDDGTSRQTIDTINTAPKTTPGGSTLATPVTITNVTIRRIGTAAQNFDTSSQNLPTPTSINTQLLNASTLQTPLQNNSILNVHNSTDLLSWSFLGSLYYDGNASLPATIGLPSPDNNTTRFYRPALTIYPNPPYIPNTPNNATLTTQTSIGTTTYTYSSTTAGTFTHTFNDNSTQSGTFTARYEQVSPIKVYVTLFPTLTNPDGDNYIFQGNLSRYTTNSSTQLTGALKGNLFLRNPETNATTISSAETNTFTLTLPPAP